MFNRGDLVKYNPPHKLTQKYSYVGHVNGYTTVPRMGFSYIQVVFYNPKIGVQPIDSHYLKFANKSILIEKIFTNQ
jgi:hypothetical protein